MIPRLGSLPTVRSSPPRILLRGSLRSRHGQQCTYRQKKLHEQPFALTNFPNDAAFKAHGFPDTLQSVLASDVKEVEGRFTQPLMHTGSQSP